MSGKKRRTWILTNHLCLCGGRVLQCASGGGPTPGGNPVFKCASCGSETSGRDPQGLCWCGWRAKGQGLRPYRCYPFSILDSHPELKIAFLEMGYDPDSKQEVGVVSSKRAATLLEGGGQ